MSSVHHTGLPIEPLAPDEFRNVLGHFCSGITVVTAALDGQTFGMTCQSFFSVSLDPPLVAFAPSKTSRSYAEIRKAGAFCLNILSEDQQEMCGGFARSGVDKFAGVGWTEGPTGSPIIDGVLAWVDCTLEAEHEAGDHQLVVGRVVALKAYDHRPLLYFKGKYRRLELDA